MFHLFWLWPLWFLFPFHGLITLFVVIVVVSLIFHRRHYYYYGHPWGWNGGTSRSEALAILEGRYARGEIQCDEYLQKKQDLGG
jgi:uncharacterized membrane protein